MVIAVGAISRVAAVVLAAASVSQLPGRCSQYALVNARGTGEAQGESSGFVVMNAFVTGNMTGGQIYNVDYPANVDQDSSAATAEIIRNVRLIADGSSNTTLPPCVILQGYSQGASAVVDALQQLTDEAAMNVVRGVILLGDPRHKPGLLSNIDNDGLTSTRASPGAGNLLNLASLPDPYVDRTIDVCIYGDGICDTTHALGVNLQHQAYPYDFATQSTGVSFMAMMLSGVQFMPPPLSN